MLNEAWASRIETRGEGNESEIIGIQGRMENDV